MAPDQASLAAARKLLTPRSWPTLATDGDGLLWGECQGSGSLPYRVVLAEADLGYKCTCPSRKFPCKHTLALMWMRAEGHAFAAQERPAWAGEWLTRRRPGAARRPPDTQPDQPSPPRSIAELPDPGENAMDPRARARAATQRERSRTERETAILAGLDELDLWIIDQIERGLAGFAAVAAEQCRLIARRLVDAKAGGLASRVEQIPPALFGLPESERAEFLVTRLGELHLIAEAYRRQHELPAALTADVRLTVGWTMSREMLLDDPSVLHVKGRWMVLAAFSEIQPDKLRRMETWLARVDDGAEPQFAVLIDFVPATAGAGTAGYSPGETFVAELAFYPSGAPLRAVIVERIGAPAQEGRWPTPPHDLPAAIENYETALAERPWLGQWPIAVRNAIVVRGHNGLALTQAAFAHMLPIATTDDDMIVPLVGVPGIDAFGLWDGQRLDLRFAETPLGRWQAA